MGFALFYFLQLVYIINTMLNVSIIVNIVYTLYIFVCQEFPFEAVPSDIMYFEVKDKFAKSRPTISRCLGVASVAVQEIMENISDV